MEQQPSDLEVDLHHRTPHLTVIRLADVPGLIERFSQSGRVPVLRARVATALLHIELAGQRTWMLMLNGTASRILHPGANPLIPPLRLKRGDRLRLRSIRLEHPWTRAAHAYFRADSVASSLEGRA